jgi:hypothetical protein
LRPLITASVSMTSLLPLRIEGCRSLVQLPPKVVPLRLARYPCRYPYDGSVVNGREWNPADSFLLFLRETRQFRDVYGCRWMSVEAGLAPPAGVEGLEKSPLIPVSGRSLSSLLPAELPTPPQPSRRRTAAVTSSRGRLTTTLHV